MTKQPRYSRGYLRHVRWEAQDWTKSQVQARDEAARKARADEIAAVLADLERNKPRSEAKTSPE